MKTVLRKTLQATILSTGLIGASAFANVVPLCPPDGGANDITTAGVTVLGCAGYFTGNVNNNSPADRATQADALTALGLTGVTAANVSILEQRDTHTSSVTFTDNTLTGISYIALHWGGGAGGGESAFYKIRIDDPNGINTINTAFGNLSNGAIYAITPVPEPGTYGMMLAGLGLLGVVARRRQNK